MIGIAITSRSALGVPATLAISGHPSVTSIVLARDLGDAASHIPSLRGVPCLILDFTTADTANEAHVRLSTISSKFTFKESPTRLVCSNDVSFTLRLVRDFDEAAIARIAEYHSDAVARYSAVQQDVPRTAPRRGRR
jgi:hypothetical protein